MPYWPRPGERYGIFCRLGRRASWGKLKSGESSLGCWTGIGLATGGKDHGGGISIIGITPEGTSNCPLFGARPGGDCAWRERLPHPGGQKDQRAPNTAHDGTGGGGELVDRVLVQYVEGTSPTSLGRRSARWF